MRATRILIEIHVKRVLLTISPTAGYTSSRAPSGGQSGAAADGHPTAPDEHARGAGRRLAALCARMVVGVHHADGSAALLLLPGQWPMDQRLAPPCCPENARILSRPPPGGRWRLHRALRRDARIARQEPDGRPDAKSVDVVMVAFSEGGQALECWLLLAPVAAAKAHKSAGASAQLMYVGGASSAAPLVSALMLSAVAVHPAAPHAGDTLIQMIGIRCKVGAGVAGGRGTGAEPVGWGGGALWVGVGVLHPRGSQDEVLEEAGDAAFDAGARALNDVTSLCMSRAVAPLHLPSTVGAGSGCTPKVIFAGATSGDVHVLCAVGAGKSVRVLLAGTVRCPRESMGKVLVVDALSPSMCAGTPTPPPFSLSPLAPSHLFSRPFFQPFSRQFFTCYPAHNRAHVSV